MTCNVLSGTLNPTQSNSAQWSEWLLADNKTGGSGVAVRAPVWNAIKN